MFLAESSWQRGHVGYAFMELSTPVDVVFPVIFVPTLALEMELCILILSPHACLKVLRMSYNIGPQPSYNWSGGGSSTLAPLYICLLSVSGIAEDIVRRQFTFSTRTGAQRSHFSSSDILVGPGNLVRDCMMLVAGSVFFWGSPRIWIHNIWVLFPDPRYLAFVSGSENLKTKSHFVSVEPGPHFLSLGSGSSFLGISI